MNPVLNHDLYFVKQERRHFKVTNKYEILDPKSKEVIMICEEELSGGVKFARYLVKKTATPFNIVIRTPNGEPVLSVKRGFNLFLSTIQVLDENQQLVGKLKQKFNLGGGKFDVLDPNDQVICQLKGKLTSWDFKFGTDKHIYAEVAKKWAGFGKELFSSADNYMLKIDPSVEYDNPLRILIVAAVMAIDMVLHEN